MVFEGIDGSGKSTLTRAVARAYGAAGDPEFPNVFPFVRELREPTYESRAGQRLREMLRGAEVAEPEAWLELFLEDRQHNVENNVLPAIREGALVLQDRYFYSTAAYQGRSGGPLTPSAILEVNRARGFPEPDLVVYLALPVDEALRRIALARANSESFETHADLARTAANYEAILPGSALRLDATLPAEHLTALVRAGISALLADASPLGNV